MPPIIACIYKLIKNKSQNLMLIFCLFFMQINQLIAVESNLKIISVRINKQPVNWFSLASYRFANYSKLNKEGLPENLELKYNAKEINFIFKIKIM